jgi:protein farnesyltransferase subunit beta
MRADFYHTLYALAGLSATQYHYIYNEKDANMEGNEPAFKWTASDVVDGDKQDRVGMVQPVFVLPWGDAERMRSWFVKKGKKMDIA